MSAANHLVIFVREPALGAGKRRLAREIGDVAAWRFHRLTTQRLLRRLAGDPRWRTWVAVTPDPAAARRRSRWPGTVRLIPQGRGDLGKRLQRVITNLPPGPVAVVGADIPDIRAAHIAEAFTTLGRADAVLGPAGDGGYWLVAVKRRPLPRFLFRGIRWGGEHALADTHAAFTKAGLSVAYGTQLRDVDTATDLRRDMWR